MSEANIGVLVTSTGERTIHSHGHISRLASPRVFTSLLLPVVTTYYPGTCTCTVFLCFLPNFPHIILNLCIHRVHIMQSIIQITTLKLETNSRIQVPGVNRLFYSWSDDRSLSTIPVCVHRYPALPVEKGLRTTVDLVPGYGKKSEVSPCST